jgi:hypothetical protein
MDDDKLYQYIFINKPWSLNYVVYRNFNDFSCLYLEEVAIAHRVASFVTEIEANEYCRHRNMLIDKYGTDDITLAIIENDIKLAGV